MQPESVVVPVELRAASGDTPARLVGTLLPIGRVAIDRQESYAGVGAVRCDRRPVAVGASRLRSDAVHADRGCHGRRVAHRRRAADTPEGREAAALVQSGQRKGLSVEFFALADKRVSQVREIRSAFIEATALCREGCYAQSTVELRSTSVKVWL